MKYDSVAILAINLKYYRHKLKLSQYDFAIQIGTTIHFESELETAKRNPSLGTLDKLSSGISKLLGETVTSVDLITYVPDRVTNKSRFDAREKSIQ